MAQLLRFASLHSGKFGLRFASLHRLPILFYLRGGGLGLHLMLLLLESRSRPQALGDRLIELALPLVVALTALVVVAIVKDLCCGGIRVF